MNSDEQFKEKIRKSVIIELYNMNVIVLTQIKIQKGQFLLPFFFTFFLDTSSYKPLNSSVTIRYEAYEAKKNITN